MTHRVRTTKRPWEEIEVDDAGYLDLKRQGLLVEETAAESVPPATAAPATPAKKSGQAGSKES
jgi:hypothetical protein